jgi:hypothetical protein
VEREIAFEVGSPENRVSICGVGVLCGTTYVQRRHTFRNKEVTTRIHPSISGVPPRLFLCFTIVSLLVVALYVVVNLGKFT